MSTKLKVLDFTLKVNLEAIISFNSNLQEEGSWGNYSTPFHSHQFVSPPQEGKGKLALLDGIPNFPANSKIQLIISPGKKVAEKYDFCVEYMRLVLIGPSEFTQMTPKKLWEKVLDLKKTKGAIGSSGDFFLSQVDDVDTFEIYSSPELETTSYNLLYEVCFSFQLNGHTKYCLVDPLIKTSSGHT